RNPRLLPPPIPPNPNPSLCQAWHPSPARIPQNTPAPILAITLPLPPPPPFLSHKILKNL
ncbi:unnamed protein product, partial [Prunus brigantina]